MNFEAIFNLQQTRKILTEQSIEKIEKKDLISDVETLKKFALSGHTPKKFITFSDDRLNYIVDSKNRKTIADKLRLPLDDKDKFKLEKEEEKSTFIKFLCNKIARDLLDETVLEIPQSTVLKL